MLTPWTVAGLALFAVLCTLVANRLAARRRATPRPATLTAVDIIASLIWIAMLTAAGVLAARYGERLSAHWIPYLIFGLAAVSLSFVRALLFRPCRPIPAGRGVVPDLAVSMLLATSLYLALSLLLRNAIHFPTWLLVVLGAALAELDSPQSAPGRLVPWLARRVESRLGQRQAWRSLGIAAAMAVATLPLAFVGDLPAWVAVPLGFVSRLLLDLLDPAGVMLLWPIGRTRYSLAGRLRATEGTRLALAAALAVLTVLLALAASRIRPRTAPIIAPSYDETFQRYLALRGRNLVFADVEGTWQATGQRVYARFEVLNAVGQSFVMLDRFTGGIFYAGRSAGDHLYLNSISLAAGDEARIKPVEFDLHGQPLASLLPTLYQMQREPGLRHIYISGDLVLPVDAGPKALQADYGQTRLPKIAAQDGRHYVLRYLTAAEIIALSEVQVETAGLVVVATYAGGADAATATPLPPPPAGEAP